MPLRIRGAEKIFRRLDQLGSIVADRVMARALRESGKIVAAEMVSLAPRQRTRDAILINKTRKSVSPFDIEYRVGPDNKDHKALWDEFGTAERFHKSGKATGRHPVRPFARPAWLRSKAEAEARFLLVLDRGINNAIRRLNPGGK